MPYTVYLPHHHHHLTHNPQSQWYPKIFRHRLNTTHLLRRPNQESKRHCNTAFNFRDGFNVIFECMGAESAIQMCLFVSIFISCLLQAVLTHSRIDGNNWRSHHPYRNGQPHSLSPTLNCRSPQSRYPWLILYTDTYPQALALLSSPSTLRTMVSKLVTHRFGLADAKTVFEVLAKGVDDKGELVLKVMVGPGVEKKKGCLRPSGPIFCWISVLSPSQLFFPS